MKNKRGLSPVIATVLLISIALVLALIIFLWARNFVSENVQKFDEPIERACESISFRAEADSSALSIVNEGNVGIYGLEVSLKSKGGTASAEASEKTVLSGRNNDIPFNNNGIDLNVETGDEILVVPRILGQTNKGNVVYTCDSKYGVPITVI